jgi:nicotinamidase/pyrazinamidase
MTALILVDIQNDFLPGGSLGVKDSDQILPIVNKLIEKPFNMILATRDWHPQDHGSFAASHGKQPGERVMLAGVEQILWPTHCVQGTKGAEFGPWNVEKAEKIFDKGTDKEMDSYSTFFDNGHRKSTGLEDYLREKNIKKIYLAGLVTDYCILYSALDACALGFDTFVIVDACQAVNLNEGDETKAFETMLQAGTRLINSQDVSDILDNQCF